MTRASMAGTAEVEAACARLASMNDPRLPLLRAAADGRIGFAYAYDPGAEWPLDAIEKVTRPVVFLIGDDPSRPGRARGPRKWSIARRVKPWTRSVIVHGAGGRPEHYREAVRAAETVGRCVMVETDSSFAHAWVHYLGCSRTLLIMPTDGAHPLSEMEGVRH